jgi:DNA repair protein RadC
MYIIPDTTLILDGSPHQYPLLLRDLPSEERPREKLQAQGPEALSVNELLAVVLHTGTTKEDVMEMSNRIIRDYGQRSLLVWRDPKKLSLDMNIPINKAFQIIAVGELGRRYYDKSQTGFTNIRNAKDVYEYLQDMRNLSKEHLRGLYLNSHNHIIRDEVISIGTINSSIIHPREVFKLGLEVSAVAVILAHNHPSGEVTPSSEDIEITKQLVRGGKILGIRVLDHVIITKDAFASVNVEY